MDLDDRCIAADSLVRGHALSFKEQPHFKTLIETLRTPQRPLVVVAGAGVSMGAGLPSWRELVDRLERSLVPERLRQAFTQLNADDLERKTDTILFLTGELGITPKNTRYLKAALYGDGIEPEPSSIAQVIAQLAAVYSRRISVITTNFDEVLETAMIESFGDSMSYSFDTWESWDQLDDDQHRSAVMHLHGLVYAEDRPSLTPLVLSESDFRLYGPQMQDRLAKLFDGADLMVVGASLADQNITGPLSQTRNRHCRRFIVATPALERDQVDAMECAEVAVWQAQALESAFGVRPLLLKSYAQVPQLLTECVLAAAEPARYKRPVKGLPAAQSLHYGTRFCRTLADAYRTLGASPVDGSMSDWKALALSSRLHELTFQKDGPHDRLVRLRERYRGKCAESENIGLFLWLRDLPRRPGAGFALRLVSTSAYAHWKSWSAFRVETVRPDSRNAAVQAAHTGRAVFMDVPRGGHSGSWQGAWAQPLIVGYSVSETEVGGLPIDQLQLGALAVNTDRKVTSDDRVRDAADLSALALLTQEEMGYFRESVDDLIEALFS